MKSLWVFFCNKWCWSQPGCSHDGYFASPVQPAIGFGVSAWDLPGFMVKGWGDEKKKCLVGFKGIQKM